MPNHIRSKSNHFKQLHPQFGTAAGLLSRPLTVVRALKAKPESYLERDMPDSRLHFQSSVILSAIVSSAPSPRRGVRLYGLLLRALVVLASLLLPVSARAQVTYAGTLNTLTTFSPEDSLSPIAVDGSGDVFFVVEDTNGNNTLYKIPFGGTLTTLQSGFAIFPAAIAVNNAGTSLYFLYSGSPAGCPGDMGGDQFLAILNSPFTGAPANLPPTFKFSGYCVGYTDPTGLAVNPNNGNLYVADCGGGSIYELNGPVTSSSTPASFVSLYVQPYDIAVNGNGTIYFTDALYYNIDSVSASLFGSTIPSSGISASIIVNNIPEIQLGLAVGPSPTNTIYVGGTTVDEVSGSSLVAVNNEFSNGTTGLGVDSSGRLFIGGTDSNLNQDIVGTSTQPYVNFGSEAANSTTSVQSLTFSIDAGTTVGSIGILTTGVAGLDFQNGGSTTCTATTYSSATNCVVSVKFKPLATGLRRGAVVFYSNANLTGTQQAIVQIYGAGTGPQAAFGPAGNSSSVGSGFTAPLGFAVDAAGNVFVADNGAGKVDKVTPGGTQTTLTSSIGNPYGVAVDGAGNLYVADSSTTVYKVTPGGTKSTVNSTFDSPYGIALDGQGNFYVSDHSAGKVYEVTPGGTKTTVYSGLSLPEGVAVDASGNVYVANNGAGEVYKMTPGGTQSTVVSGLTSPDGVSVDGAGTVYISDDSEHAVYQVPSGGSKATVSTETSGGFGLAIDGSGNLYTSGQTSGPVIELNRATPPPVNFPTVTPVNTIDSDGPMIVEMENIGTSTLDIASIAFPADFLEVSGEDDCGSTLAESALCNIDIEFMPLSVNTRGFTEYVSIPDNSLNLTSTTQSIKVTGASTVDPVLSVAKSHTGNFTQGSTAVWNIWISNIAAASSQTSGTTTVYDPLPTGYTLASYSGAGWICSGTATVTCYSTSGIFGGSSFSTLQLTVNVPYGSPTPVSNTAYAWGGGDLTHNNLANAAMGSDSSVPVARLSSSTSVTIDDSSTDQAWSGAETVGASAYGAASITPGGSGGPAPTGTVTYTLFMYNGCSGYSIAASTKNLSSGAAPNSNSSAPLIAGPYSMSASYSGDNTYLSSSSCANFIVNEAATSTSVTSSLNPSAGGQLVILTATINAVPGVEPSGIVGFTSNSIGIAGCGAVTVSLGQARCVTMLLPIGNNAIVATYSGDEIYLPSSGTLSGGQQVNTPNLVVTTPNDDNPGNAGNCTAQTTPGTGTDSVCGLRDALAYAARAGAANITFDSTAFAATNTAAKNTITLGSAGTMTIPANTAIAGPTTGSGATLTNLVTVSGNKATTVFTVNGDVTGASISGLNIINGYVGYTGYVNAASGGGILNNGALTVANSTISGNSATSAAEASGGGISNSGTLTVNDCTISGNRATSASEAGGGGIVNNPAAVLNLNNSTLSGNSASANGGGGGGAIVNNGGTVTVTNSTISANTADGIAGGLYNNSGTVNLANSIFSGNTVGGSPDDIDPAGSYTDNQGNLIGDSVSLTALGNYGGPTQTMLPLPGSSAICGGLASNDTANHIATDQRGFSFLSTYCPSSHVDAGAVQTNYALSFTTGPGSSQVAGVPFTAAVTLTESGNPLAGVGIPVTLNGGGTLTGSPVSETTNSSGVASYMLTVTNPTALSGLTLTATLPAPPSLTATSGSLALSEPPPTVSGVSPSSGPMVGGTSVTITGTNFTGATGVTIGGAAATNVVVVSNTTITAVTPAGAAGTASVVVTTQGGSNAASTLFTYVAPPTVSSVSPSSGPTAGGTSVTITGTNLTGATGVTIGGAAATGVVVVSNTTITAVTPAGAAGTASVVVTTLGGSNAANTLFTYVAPPAVSSVSPSSGPTAGGTSVTITGTNFTGATAVKFGAVPATGFTVASSTTITATSPAGTGAVDLTVTTTGGTSAISTADLFTYLFPTTTTASNATTTYSANAQNVLVSATVTSTSGTVSEGTVTFTVLNNGTPVGPIATGAVSNGSAGASYSLPAGTAAGMYTIQAVYNDASGNFSASTDSSRTLSVGQAAQTIGFTPAIPPAITSYTYSPTGTFAVSATATSGLSVSFASTTSNICTVSGTMVSMASAGTCTIQATQVGNANYAAAAPVQVNFIIGQATQIIGFTLSSPATYGVAPIPLSATGGASGNAVTFSVVSGPGSINANTLTVTGAGTIVVAANQLGNTDYSAAAQVTASLVVNAATLTVTANNASKVYGTANPAFTGAVTGQQNGDTFTESFSTSATQWSPVGTYAILPAVAGAELGGYTEAVHDGTLTVSQAGTTTALGVSSNSITPLQSVTLTATIAPIAGGSPTGTVTFFDGTSNLGTAPLSGDVATYTASALAPGLTHTLTATYNGDSNFTASNATASVTVTVAPLDFTMTISGPSSATAIPGGNITYQVTVTPDYGMYAGTVNFTVSGLPPGATASFSPATIPSNGGPQTIAVTIHTAAATAAARQASGLRWQPLALAFLLLFGAGAMRRQGRRLRRLLPVVLLLLAGGAAVALTGCGGNGFFTQTAKNYTVTITASAGSLEHTANITLNVQ